MRTVGRVIAGVLFFLMILMWWVGTPKDQLRGKVVDVLTRRYSISAAELDLLSGSTIKAVVAEVPDGEHSKANPNALADAVVAREPDSLGKRGISADGLRALALESELGLPRTWGGNKLLSYTREPYGLYVDVYVESMLTPSVLVRGNLAKVMPALFKAADLGFNRVEVEYHLPAEQQVDQYGHQLAEENLVRVAHFSVPISELVKFNRRTAEKAPVYVADRFDNFIHPDIRSAWKEGAESDRVTFNQG